MGAGLANGQDAGLWSGTGASWGGHSCRYAVYAVSGPASRVPRFRRIIHMDTAPMRPFTHCGASRRGAKDERLVGDSIASFVEERRTVTSVAMLPSTRRGFWEGLWRRRTVPQEPNHFSTAAVIMG